MIADVTVSNHFALYDLQPPGTVAMCGASHVHRTLERHCCKPAALGSYTHSSNIHMPSQCTMYIASLWARIFTSKPSMYVSPGTNAVFSMLSNASRSVLTAFCVQYSTQHVLEAHSSGRTPLEPIEQAIHGDAN